MMKAIRNLFKVSDKAYKSDNPGNPSQDVNCNITVNAEVSNNGTVKKVNLNYSFKMTTK